MLAACRRGGLSPSRPGLATLVRSAAPRAAGPTGPRASGLVPGLATRQALPAWPQSRALFGGFQRRPVDVVIWSLRVNLENTYLSWTRNSIIATVAGCAMIQYKVDHAKLDHMPLSGLGFLLLGFMFMTLGPMSYLHASWMLRHTLGLCGIDWMWIWFNALTPPALWTSSMYCFLNGAPEFLSETLERLRHRQGVITAFIDPAPASIHHHDQEQHQNENQSESHSLH